MIGARRNSRSGSRSAAALAPVQPVRSSQICSMRSESGAAFSCTCSIIHAFRGVGKGPCLPFRKMAVILRRGREGLHPGPAFRIVVYLVISTLCIFAGMVSFRLCWPSLLLTGCKPGAVQLATSPMETHNSTAGIRAPARYASSGHWRARRGGRRRRCPTPAFRPLQQGWRDPGS